VAEKEAALHLQKMDGLEITRILEANEMTRRNFQGCFPLDQIPNPSTLPSPSSMIINLSPSSDAGSHWVAMYSEGMNRKPIYFDSLALKPIKSEIMNFLKNFPLGFIQNRRPYQCTFSNVCAHYCMAFIFHMSLPNSSFNSFLSILDKNCLQSDLYVREIVKKI
jgi:hypothetical protein